jgi:hypothetical protein
VQIFSASLKASDPFIVMEWMAGGSWYDALAEDPPPPAYQRIRAARETASALAYLHHLLIGIIHGDIKGLNVLRARDGSSKVHPALPTPPCHLHVFILLLLQVCDFGGAVHMMATLSMTTSGGGGRMATTRAWSAPELFTGGSKTTSSDMYAFGVFMWELMTCMVPFDGVSPDLIGDQVKAGVRPPIPSPLPEGFPPAFVDIIMTCLHHDPHQRPSAQQVHHRLLLMDSTARPSVPLHLFDARTAAPASLLQCITHAMQAASGQPNAHLSKALAAMVNFAAQFVSSSASVQQLMQQHQLTDMQAQTVCLYTLDARQHGGLREHSVFYLYNAALRSGEADAVALWGEYSFVFCSALEQLPSVAATVFRGLDLPLTQLSHMYSKGSTVWLNSVTSTTTDKDQTLLQFGAGASGRPGTLLQIIAVDAKDIKAFSPFPESELLIPPNSCHTVQTVLESAEVSRMPAAAVRSADAAVSGASTGAVRQLARRRRLDRHAAGEGFCRQGRCYRRQSVRRRSCSAYFISSPSVSRATKPVCIPTAFQPTCTRPTTSAAPCLVSDACRRSPCAAVCNG